jgi:Protein of unknown function (DUF2752)
MNRKVTALSSAAFAGTMAVLYAFPPAQYTFYPRCPIYESTHLLCPGCGGTRALYELLHFNLRGALHYNALVTVLFPLALLWLAANGYRAYRNGRSVRLTLPMPVLAGLLLIAVLFSVARNLGMGWLA